MSKFRLLSSLILIAVTLAACAPGNGPASAGQTATESAPEVVSATDTATPVALSSTEEPAPSPLPVATSRGPELHATDPASVNLASGGLQLVEFFRFT